MKRKRKIRQKHGDKVHYSKDSDPNLPASRLSYYCTGTMSVIGDTEAPDAVVSCLQCIWKDVKEFEDNE